MPNIVLYSPEGFSHVAAETLKAQKPDAAKMVKEIVHLLSPRESDAQPTSATPEKDRLVPDEGHAGQIR
jgi:hypothetical protein